MPWLKGENQGINRGAPFIEDMDFGRLAQQLGQKAQQKAQQSQGQQSSQSQQKNATDYRERILRFIRSHGPSVPNEIRREIGKDNLIASAMLSELSSNKNVRVSHLKVGSSPLYYLPGQESQLLRFSEYLHVREREALEYLRQEVVVRDVDLAPVQRVSMRELKDFAEPITVQLYGLEELFWKWYLAKNEDIVEKVRQLMPAPQVKVEPVVAQQEPEVLPEKKPEKQEVLARSEVAWQKRDERKQRPPEKAPQKEPEKPVEEKQKEPKQRRGQGKQAQLSPDDDRFYQKVRAYCQEKGLAIRSAEIVKKNAELDLVVEVPSAVGQLTYFCKAKAKALCTDNDLALAMMEAQERNLPALLLTTGKVSAKALQKLDRGLKGLIVKTM